ncbi:thiol:disulfide interchange protein [Leptospira perolatii]|uniref:Thiol:disulfide interchange protein n=1 Tax=Leptospira perolatii TaxID=2023191 RepID=A0A2M9ZNH9_9LEPT|nr:thioredoxin family protein [Leptospira perolatii]PJZ69635.1 thiol:disulfide interchange protein [Leptospira perolatii]PJZ73622.1 thiol:disulfide interchange protein [Leptospira perolatii]
MRGWKYIFDLFSSRLLSVFLIFTISNSLSSKVLWETSVEEAFQKAKSEGKPIFIDVYADWCGYCKTLKNEIYPRKEVQAELSKFVLLSLDGDRFPNLKRKYDISGYPTLLFLDKNGSLTEKIAGMPDSRMIVRTLKKAYDKRDLEKSLLSKLSKDPSDPKSLFALGEYYFNSRDYKKAAEFFYKTLESDSPRFKDRKHQALFNLGVTYSAMEQHSKAVKTFSLYIEKFPPGSGFTNLAYYYRGLANKELGKKEEAIQDLDKALELTTDLTEKKEIEEDRKSIQ